MLNETLEFQISQYLDGNLSPADRALVESQMASNPDAAAVLNEYRLLTRALETTLQLPPINFNELSQNISNAIDSEYPAQYSAPPMRIGNWTSTLSRLAMAAVVGLVLSLAFQFATYHKSPTPAAVPQSVAQVEGPAPEAAIANAITVADVEVGPPTHARVAEGYTLQSVVSAPQRSIVFASDAATGENGRRQD